MINIGLTVPEALLVALLWLTFGLCALGVSFSSSTVSRLLIAAMASSVSVIAIWSAIDRTFWDAQGPRWWFAAALAMPVLGFVSRSIERVGADAMFTVSVAVFLSMSSGLFGLHDVWTPAVVMLAGAIVVAVLRERCDSSGSTMFQRYAGLSSALVAIAWVPVFLTQPVAT